MENWKVREVSSEEKSQAQVEQELLDKAEAKNSEQVTEEKGETTEVAQEEKIDESKPTQEVPVTEDSPTPQMTEEDVLSFLKNRYNDEITSLDEFRNKQQESEKLPDEVSSYLKFSKETGKGFDEFVKINRDFDSIPADDLIREYYSEIKPHLDSEDLEFEMGEKFGYDESIDDEASIRKRKIAKKEVHKEAMDYFNKKKSDYSTIVESTKTNEEKINEKSNAESNSVSQGEINKRNAFFSEKTNAYFDKFDGFEYNFNDQKIKYTVSDVNKTKENQSDLNNFIKLHVTNDGYLKDAESYHKAMAAAFNPDGFAKFFYEKGKADAISADVKATKNIDMGLRSKPVTSQAPKLKVTALSKDSGNSLRIKSNKNKQN